MGLSGRISISAGRSREGAWIEILNAAATCCAALVAPARERGLKLELITLIMLNLLSLPRGSVD